MRLNKCGGRDLIQVRFQLRAVLQASARSEIMISLGLEGSANKLGVGVVQHSPLGGDPSILANLRHTYIAPPGEGFLPKDTARHHRAWITRLVKDAIRQANVNVRDITCICFTKGPGMGGPLQSVALAARSLALMWDKDMVAVNHCVGRMNFSDRPAGVRC